MFRRLLAILLLLLLITGTIYAQVVTEEPAPPVAASLSTVSGLNGAIWDYNYHLYREFNADSIPWETARAIASGMSSGHCTAYLVTITSAQETTFVATHFNIFSKWLGGFQNPGVTPANAGWQWVTGEPWVYTNWNNSEPNDAWGPASEQHLIGGAPDGTWNDEGIVEHANGYIVEYECGVTIDIKPGSEPNCLNSNAHGVIPVAILTTASFDAASVDPFSLSLDGAPVRAKGNSGRAGALEDVDGDGDLDLVVQFEDLGQYPAGNSVAVLTGMTYSSLPVVGHDDICVVPR